MLPKKNMILLLTINKFSALSAIGTSLVLLAYRFYKQISLTLSDLVLASLSGGMIPLGIGFLVYPFIPSVIGSIEEMGLQITLIGIVLLYVAITSAWNRIKSDSS